jgi:hypothetical protein
MCRSAVSYLITRASPISSQPITGTNGKEQALQPLLTSIRSFRREEVDMVQVEVTMRISRHALVGSSLDQGAEPGESFFG